MKLHFKINYTKPFAYKTSMGEILRNNHIDEDITKLVQCKDRLLNSSDNDKEVMWKGNHLAINAIYCLSYIYNFNGNDFQSDNLCGSVFGDKPMGIVSGNNTYIANPNTWLSYLKSLRKVLDRHVTAIAHS